jgi:hypothetical protein
MELAIAVSHLQSNHPPTELVDLLKLMLHAIVPESHSQVANSTTHAIVPPTLLELSHQEILLSRTHHANAQTQQAMKTVHAALKERTS